VRFGEIDIEAAVGAILAHSIPVPGGVFKKGRLLSTADVAALRAAGRTRVFAAHLAADDIGEDAAAAQLARALAGAGIRVAAAFTGRCNLYAAAAGVLRIDRAAVEAVNAVDECLTVATLAANERVAVEQMVGTVKVIPFAVRPGPLQTACRLAEAALSVAAFQPRRFGLVLTTLPAIKSSAVDKRRQAIEARLGTLGSTLVTTRVVEHTTQAVADALRAVERETADVTLVFAASAIVDRADVIPAGLVAAGGQIERLGMPVDPGNLLLLGALDGRPVVGVPSCAASPKLNGFDWVLEQLVAGLPIDGPAIAAMGVGGLLKEIPTRPQPREAPREAPREEGEPAQAATSPRRAPKVAALVLAAGRATRMGSNKLLEPVDGRPIVRHVVDAAQASAAALTVVVTGHQADELRRTLAASGVTFVANPDFAQGLASSLKAGLASLPADTDAVLVLLGDMPDVSAQHLDRLIAAFSPADGRTIVVPTRDGKRGNPVLWGRLHFAAMAEATGDTGAKHLIGSRPESVVEIDLGTDAIFLDVDTPAALAARRGASAD
jgi:molybdenum cofactor cytidylyltransferase